jgi:hypothetical protein
VGKTSAATIIAQIFDCLFSPYVRLVNILKVSSENRQSDENLLNFSAKKEGFL